MPIEQRSRGKLPGPGPYVARITNLLDPMYMGSIEVTLEKGFVGDASLQSQTYVCQYLSPFYGVTSVKYEGTNQQDFNSVQKSYGMWMVPPDIGTTVLVMFIDGDANQGYWIGCVADKFQNHMVPGIAASQNVYMTPEQELKYGTKNLPVAEFHKKSIKDNLSPNSQMKPIHPFADRLLAQGLLLDNVRGITSSSARREVPSSVFGISTPGPLDTSTDAPKASIGYDANVGQPVPISRLGGTTFVMDDGDKDGQNELVRIRTRTGHQILMHNSSDLVYIANSKGTAWIELTSNGKIDIYAQDSVSIHTENDFNFKADRDINFEAGRNINMNAFSGIDINCVDRFNLICNKDGKILIGADLHITADSDIRMHSKATTHILSNDNMFIQATPTLNIKAATIDETADTVSLQAGTYNETVTGTSSYKWNGTKFTFTGADTHNTWNSATDHYSTTPRSSDNSPSGGASATPATPAEIATRPQPLSTFSLPNRSVDLGWANGKFYKSEDIVSIMKRVPTHEPWDQHENTNPNAYTPNATTTDRYDPTSGSSPSVTYNQVPAVKGVPPTPTGNAEEDNIAAFLWMVRVCEGTSGPQGYQVMFTGKLFPVDDPTVSTYQFKDHPRIANRGGGITSTAAGAYQFLSSTWDQARKQLNLPDFSPTSQDKACIYLFRLRKALDDIKAGNFTSAINKCNKEWASLPGSPYNQHPKNLGVALAYYKQGGGTAVA